MRKKGFQLRSNVRHFIVESVDECIRLDCQMDQSNIQLQPSICMDNT